MSPDGFTMRAFLTLAVATAIAITSVGYVAGSTPELVMMKSSIGMMAVGAIGWMASLIVSRSSERELNESFEGKESGGRMADGKGANVDFTVSEAASGDHTA